MQYISTRSNDNPPKVYGFEEAVMLGLASDGGLFLPSELTPLTDEELSQIQANPTFKSIAFVIFSKFIPKDCINSEELKSLIERSFNSFSHKDITPLIKLPLTEQQIKSDQNNLYLLELFHGPTFAFKDVALQFLGNLFEFFLNRKNSNLKENEKRNKITIVGATSGDTGGAAIYGLRNKKDIEVFILHPKGKVSPVQEAQMTLVLDENVHNLSVQGTFDDCQSIVKSLFNDSKFRNDYSLGAVNSINLARILAQTVYYFYSYYQLPNLNQSNVIYSVPTGNFGDVLAGFYSQQLGLPIKKFIIATNENDILHRTLIDGKYEIKDKVKETLSPAMDIQVSSNFERVLWLANKKGLNLNDFESCSNLNLFMNEFKSTNKVDLNNRVLLKLREWFISDRVDDEQIKTTIKEFYENDDKYLLDPHTAVGVKAALRYQLLSNEPSTSNITTTLICLATAHPGKFPDAIKDSLPSNLEKHLDFDELMFKNYLPSPFLNWFNLNQPKNIDFINDINPESVKNLIIQKVKN